MVELRKLVLRRMGLDGSRTRGFNRILEQTLQRFMRLNYVTSVSGARPSPRPKHASVVGRQVKPAKVGCCTVSPAEEEAMSRVKSHMCVYFEATAEGKKALTT